MLQLPGFPTCLANCKRILLVVYGAGILLKDEGKLNTPMLQQHTGSGETMQKRNLPEEELNEPLRRRPGL
jgi:hypothetical protein